LNVRFPLGGLETLSLPNFQQLMLPTLRHVCEANDEVQISVLEDEIAQKLALSKDDLSRVLPSGQQSVFANRLNWARLYDGGRAA
jgi:restriction system protein